ncbi:hypothetical protein MTP03_29080 [Tsukamurella sp. PLM1]|nr:hypothetical protein MTP03_29080 [Tsukamurella sp. PLM1]
MGALGVGALARELPGDPAARAVRGRDAAVDGGRELDGDHRPAVPLPEQPLGERPRFDSEVLDLDAGRAQGVRSPAASGLGSAAA